MTQEGLVAVLDVGKTNVKVVLYDSRSAREVSARTMPNVVRQDGPYPHFDIALMEAFFLDGLAGVVREAGAGLGAISVTTHGAAGALVGPGGLVLPILDYEHGGPDTVAEDYDRIRPAFSETFSPRLRGGLNLGAQLFWQAARFPAAFAAASAFVTYPQYWSWWLTGVTADEPTSLGAHTDLWAPRDARFSSLVGRAGWTGLMAPVRPAFDVLGPVRPALAQRIGLTGPVPVTCGIHDSNASLLPHLQGAAVPLSVVSTGTWAIVFAVGGAIDRLDAARDTLANVDAYGRTTPSARFMGGREFDILTRKAVVEPDAAAVASVLAKGAMALPTFAPGNGPFPHAEGRWSHDPEALTPAERTAAASLYIALMTTTCLDLLQARGPTIIEGPFACNALYRDAVMALTGRALVAAPGSTGTAPGAARLALPSDRAAAPLATTAATFTLGAPFAAYAARWESLAYA